MRHRKNDRRPIIISASIMFGVYFGVCCGVPLLFPGQGKGTAAAIYAGFLYCSPLPLAFLAVKLAEVIELFRDLPAIRRNRRYRKRQPDGPDEGPGQAGRFTPVRRRARRVPRPPSG